jgi:glycosyltransferase 2 family protein
MRQRVRTVLILLLTFGLLAYFLRNADVHGVVAETRRARPMLLLLAVVVTGATYLLRALRWQYLLAPLGQVHFSNAFRTTVIGFAATFLLPARAGEVIRPYLLARREGLPATAAFATIILERLLDLVTVLALFAVFVLTVSADTLTSANPAHLARVKFGGLIAGAAAFAALTIAALAAGHPERLGRWAFGIERVLPEKLARAVAHFVEAFTQGLAVMRQPRRLFVALALSIPLWSSIAAGTWLTSLAFHITFPYMGSFLVTTVLVVGVAMPTPGAVGGFHAAYQIAVQSFFAAPNDRAIGAAIVLHALSFLPVTFLGLVFMAREGLTLGRAKAIAEERQTSADSDSEDGKPSWARTTR